MGHRPVTSANTKPTADPRVQSTKAPHRCANSGSGHLAVRSPPLAASVCALASIRHGADQSWSVSLALAPSSLSFRTHGSRATRVEFLLAGMSACVELVSSCHSLCRSRHVLTVTSSATGDSVSCSSARSVLVWRSAAVSRGPSTTRVRRAMRSRRYGSSCGALGPRYPMHSASSGGSCRATSNRARKLAVAPAGSCTDADRSTRPS